MGWYYIVEGREQGPVGKRQLQKLINQRIIDAETFVRKDGEENQQTLAEMVAAQHNGQGPGRRKPAVSTEKSTDKFGDRPPPPKKVTAGSQVPPKARSGSKTKGGGAQIALPFAFTGSGGEYFRIWIVNAVLSVLTLGIYSAWAKVRRKQYFYGNTRVADNAFHYLADPVKILKGRIMVAGGFMLITAANQFFPLFGNLVMVLLIPALPWFVVRSQTFNACNSAIRNIRFNFHGTYREAFKVFVLWPLLIPLTLGLIAPYLIYLQKRFIVENSAYGTARFSFAATPRDYYGIFFKLILPFILCIALAAGMSLVFSPGSVLVFVIFYLYAMAFFAVKANNLLYNSGNLADNGFKATMEVKEYLYILVTNTIATVLTLGFFHPFAQVRTQQYKMSRLALMSGGDLERFVADEQQQVSALGDEVSDFMDFDIGL